MRYYKDDNNDRGRNYKKGLFKGKGERVVSILLVTAFYIVTLRESLDPNINVSSSLRF